MTRKATAKQTDLYDFLPGGNLHGEKKKPLKVVERSFDGKTFDQKKDGKRLSGQLTNIRSIMSDGQWRSLVEIAGLAACSDSSASARIRDLRKGRFGGHVVESRRRDGGGTWEYRLVKAAASRP